LRLLNLLGDQEVCVCYLVEVLRETQPNVSRHLAVLRKARLIEARREGKWMHYRIANPKDKQLGKLLTDIRTWLPMDSEMRKERSRLVKYGCGRSVPEQLRAAPRPIRLTHLEAHRL
jgi:ArsR family transcriptional regulator